MSRRTQAASGRGLSPVSRAGIACPNRARTHHGYAIHNATPSNPAFCYRYYSATPPAVTLTYPTPLHQEPQQRGSSAAKKKGRKKERERKKKRKKKKRKKKREKKREYQLDKVIGIPRLVTEQVTKSGTQGLYTPVWTFSTASCARMARAL